MKISERLSGVYIHGRAGHPCPSYCARGSEAYKAWKRGHDEFKASAHLDDDENVKMMRETAQQIGLTDLLRMAVRLLGDRS